MFLIIFIILTLLITVTALIILLVYAKNNKCTYASTYGKNDLVPLPSKELSDYILSVYPQLGTVDDKFMKNFLAVNEFYYETVPTLTICQLNSASGFSAIYNPCANNLPGEPPELGVLWMPVWYKVGTGKINKYPKYDWWNNINLHGFPDNSYIEVMHVNDSQPLYPVYGYWCYYTRGSGVWMNVGKSLIGRNKFEIISKILKLGGKLTVDFDKNGNSTKTTTSFSEYLLAPKENNPNSAKSANLSACNGVDVTFAVAAQNWFGINGSATSEMRKLAGAPLSPTIVTDLEAVQYLINAVLAEPLSGVPNGPPYLVPFNCTPPSMKTFWYYMDRMNNTADMDGEITRNAKELGFDSVQMTTETNGSQGIDFEIVWVGMDPLLKTSETAWKGWDYILKRMKRFVPKYDSNDYKIGRYFTDSDSSIPCTYNYPSDRVVCEEMNILKT